MPHAAIVAALLVGGGLLVWAIRLPRLIRLTYRWLAGHHLVHGRTLTDATWTRAATRGLTPHPVGRYWHRPGWHRTARRVGTLAVTVLALAAYVTGSGWLWGLLVAALVSGAAFVAWRAVRAVYGYRHRNRYVRPLERALRPILGYPAHVRTDSWLSVPLLFSRDGAQTRVTMPEGFDGLPDVKKSVARVVSDKLGVELDASWSNVGRTFATFTPVPKPPKRVAFEDLRELIDKAPESAPVIGLGHRSTPISADYDADSPHLLVSAGSGGGKSVLARGQIAQALHNGALAAVLDLKRISHAWAKGLPNVRYARSVEEIHDTLLALRFEVDRRNLAVDEYADQDGNVDPVKIGPRLFIVAEEMNATINRLKEYWGTIKEKGEPNTSPAVQALGDILFMGRAVRVHVIGIAQMMTARTLGGPEARENFAVRCLARYSMNAARMLAPEVWPFPKSSRHAGRWQIVYAGEAHETQVMWITNDEARAWASSGTVARWGVPGSQVPQERPEQAQEAGTVPGLHLVPDDDGTEPVGLSEAVDAAIVSVSLDVLRSARKRDDEFPAAIGKRGAELLYDPDALTRWERNRPRATRAGTDG